MLNKLQQAIALIKSGDSQRGRQLLAEILQVEPKNEAAWLWMSNVVSTDEQRRHCLKQVLLINPHHHLAQKGLALLEQRSQKPSPPTPQPTASPKHRIAQAPVEASSEAMVSTEESLKRPKGLNLPTLETPPGVTPVPVPAAPAQLPSEIKRVWINPKAALKVVVLYDEAIALASPGDKELNRLQAVLGRGTPPPELLGSNVKLFYFKEINSIKAVPEADSLHISYAKGQNIALQRIPFASEDALHEFMRVLQAKLGPQFEQTVKKYSAFEASITPLILLGIIILATYFLYGAAVEAATGVGLEISGRRQLLKLVFAWLIMLLGPNGVLVVGILLIALVLFWLVARILNPPTQLILTPVKNRPLPQTQAKVAGPALPVSSANSPPASEKTQTQPADLFDAASSVAPSPQKDRAVKTGRESD